jgi:hypothetical protein
MVEVFCEAKTAQTEYAKKKKAKESGEKEVDNLEELDTKRRDAKEECIRYVWKIYEAAGHNFKEAKNNLDIAWEMEKEKNGVVDEEDADWEEENCRAFDYMYEYE